MTFIDVWRPADYFFRDVFDFEFWRYVLERLIWKTGNSRAAGREQTDTVCAVCIYRTPFCQRTGAVEFYSALTLSHTYDLIS